MTVKVGVIGESIPILSKKRCDYTGVLNGEDMVANVKKETKILKVPEQISLWYWRIPAWEVSSRH